MSEHILVSSPIEYIAQEYSIVSEDEAAGPVVALFSAIGAVVSAVGSAIASATLAVSSVVTSGFTAIGVSSGLATTLGGIIGKAALGGVLNAGVAYASGARGSDVWRAAGLGALSAGVTAGITGSAASTAAGSIGAAANTAKALAITGKPILGAAAAGAGSITPTIAQAALPLSSGVSRTIQSLFGSINNTTLSRIGAALINAALNNQSMGRLKGLVDQQKSELEALRRSDLAAYNQRISVAQQILADADRLDPAWHARIAMADVAGMEANQFRQAMRNIATRQGGSFDAGQQKAYERGAALHSARSRALASNRKFTEAQTAQIAARAQAATLFGPNEAGFRNLQQQHELDAGRERARREADNSTWGGFGAALFEGDYSPATSPDPSANDENDSGFYAGLRNPFGGGN